MIEIKLPRDLVAAGMVCLRLLGRVIRSVNVAKNALVKKFITLYRYVWAALSSIPVTLLHYAKRAIMKSATALFRK